MPAGPCTGALRRKLPTGHPSGLVAGARVPPGCSRHRSFDGGSRRPARLREVIPRSHPERYRSLAHPPWRMSRTACGPPSRPAPRLEDRRPAVAGPAAWRPGDGRRRRGRCLLRPRVRCPGRLAGSRQLPARPAQGRCARRLEARPPRPEPRPPGRHRAGPVGPRRGSAGARWRRDAEVVDTTIAAGRLVQGDGGSRAGMLRGQGRGHADAGFGRDAAPCVMRSSRNSLASRRLAKAAEGLHSSG